MKIRCIICKHEKELTKEEIADLTKIVLVNPKAKSTDYLEHLNIMFGHTCKDDKRHRYVFDEAFLESVNDKAANVKKYQNEFNKLDSRDVELKVKIESMYNEIRKTAQERADVIESKNSTSDALELHKEIFKDVACTDKIELWS